MATVMQLIPMGQAQGLPLQQKLLVSLVPQHHRQHDAGPGGGGEDFGIGDFGVVSDVTSR